MNARENLMAVLRDEEPERVPWIIYSEVIGRGSLERELRNMGMGIIYAWTPLCKSELPNVGIEDREVGKILQRTFHTPVGSASMKIRTGLKRGTGGKWVIEHLVKDISDYNVVKFIVEDTVYSPDYDLFVELKRDIEGDGVVAAGVDPTPLTKLWVDYMGLQRLSIDLFKHSKELDELVQTIGKKQEEMYRIVADSPAELVWCGDQIGGGVISSPKIFRKYYLPAFERYAEILHAKDKIFAVHMDGPHLRNLKDYIKEANVDVVDAFTPPPMGNLTLKEARETWKDKYAIWVNFPETVFYYGRREVRKYLVHLLRDEAAPGDHLVIGITEDIPPTLVKEGLTTVTRTLRRYGKYPISSV